MYIPFGLNLYFQDGAFDGHRLAVEWFYPVHEDLNGPQLSVANTFVVSWQVAF